MNKNFYPDFYCESVRDIDFEALKNKGIKGIIFDIDNTLVKDGVKSANEENVALFKSLKASGFKIALLSNNSSERVRDYGVDLGIFSMGRANKPSRKGYRAASAHMALSPCEIAMVGDQIYTDVWGANRSGMMSILVRPHNPNETFFCVIKRVFEKGIIKKARKQEEFLNG